MEVGQRDAVQEWVKWQIITAGIFCLNGGAYSIIFPYYSKLPLPGATSLPNFGPTVVFGVPPSPEFPLASPILATGPTLPLAGLLMLVAGPILALFEADIISGIMSIPDFFKGLLYIGLGSVIATQLSGIQPGFFFVFAGLCLLYNSMASSSMSDNTLPR